MFHYSCNLFIDNVLIDKLRHTSDLFILKYHLFPAMKTMQVLKSVLLTLLCKTFSYL